MPRARPARVLTRDCLVTLAEVQAELRVGRPRALELLGELPHVRPGRARLWRWGQVLDHVYGGGEAAPPTRTWAGPRRALRS